MRAFSLCGQSKAFPPQGIRAKLEGDSVTLTWDPNAESNLVGYRVFRSKSAGGPLKPIHAKAFDDTSFTDNNLVFGQSYWYYIASYNSMNQGSRLSEPTVIIARKGELQPPTGMLMRGVAAISDGYSYKRCPNISQFQPVSPGTVEYKLYRGFNLGQPFTLLHDARYNLDDPSVVDYTVKWGHTHYYYLTAVDQNGDESAPSEIMSFELKEPVELLTPSKDAIFKRGTTMKVNWECSYDFDEYDVYINKVTLDGSSVIHTETVNTKKTLEIFLDQSKFVPGDYIVAVTSARTILSNHDVIVTNSYFRPFVIE